MKLSVIILNYNVRHFLELCVGSVQKAVDGIDAEIIVVDNNSQDDSCDMMKSRFPQIKLIENKENSGFPKGNNIGAAQAKGQYICILNPDTVVAEDTFSKVLAFAEKQQDLGIVGVKLIDGTGNFLPESKRGIPTPWVAFTKIFGLYKLSPKAFGKYYAMDLPENQTGEVDILVGAFMLMKRDLYNELHGFDENCFMYADDIDLSYRSLLLQKHNYYFHETAVIHYKGESTVKDGVYMKHFRDFLNFFYSKHFKKSMFFDVMAKSGAFYFAAIKRFQGKPKAKIKPNLFILVSENQSLKAKIENALVATIQMQQAVPSPKTFSGKEHVQVIFDNNFLDFQTILDAFVTLKNGRTTFRIIPQDADYMIGSDSNVDRGTVIHVAK
ncbi:glycosyltransferase family 2 protein [Flavobacterium pallidum]|uniref:Glycosyl transferase family 2 n=1 Tax=Flavobacterium pallidum TaxID=2172098 RepID=A0A2S1SHU2_9FLAO|nr:glycosyltransferase family 2 protein [Flavobacterium pallidum]AWI25912.1 glycosyl transferase family 2 [Flavobacterium pallidum]